jgi:hypothetical protein
MIKIVKCFKRPGLLLDIIPLTLKDKQIKEYRSTVLSRVKVSEFKD